MSQELPSACMRPLCRRSCGRQAGLGLLSLALPPCASTPLSPPPPPLPALSLLQIGVFGGSSRCWAAWDAARPGAAQCSTAQRSALHRACCCQLPAPRLSINLSFLSAQAAMSTLRILNRALYSHGQHSGWHACMPASQPMLRFAGPPVSGTVKAAPSPGQQWHACSACCSAVRTSGPAWLQERPQNPGAHPHQLRGLLGKRAHCLPPMRCSRALHALTAGATDCSAGARKAAPTASQV